MPEEFQGASPHQELSVRKEKRKTEGKKERKMRLMFPPMWITVLLHFRVGLSLYIIPKWTLRGLAGPERLLPPFKGEHLEHA